MPDQAAEFRSPTDLFYLAKFDDDGNVRPGWSYAEWLTWWWADVPKTSTRHCHTSGH